MENKYNIWLIITILGLIAALVYTNLKNENNTQSQITKTIIKSDTTLIVDTFYYPQPYPIEIKVVDTMYIPIDSVKTEGDSILLLKETKTYEDSTYRAVISGFHPKLEEITIFPRTIYITKEKTNTVTKKQRFTWGLQGGFGYGLVHRKPDFFIGLGCQINF